MMNRRNLLRAALAFLFAPLELLLHARTRRIEKEESFVFTRRELEMLLFARTALCKSGIYVDAVSTIMFIESAASNDSELRSAKWQQGSFHYKALERGHRKLQTKFGAEYSRTDHLECREFARAARYWLSEYPWMPVRVREAVRLRVIEELEAIAYRCWKYGC